MFNEDLFKDVIGYDEEKESLKRVIDMLNNPDKYKELGCDMLHNLILYGPPGTGKTTLAMSFLNAVDCRNYIVRREGDDASLFNKLQSVFVEAKNNAPAIILLDDMDKFDTSSTSNDIYSTIQSYIDEIKNTGVFLIATANNIEDVPHSLIRKGRFDIRMEIKEPDEKDSKEIIAKYLKEKKIDKDVNIDHVNNIVAGHSCAELETVCKQAGMYAGYKNQKTIKMEDILRASLELLYGSESDELDAADNLLLEETAYHEAGHAIIGNYYSPGSVRFMSITKNFVKQGLIVYHQDHEEREKESKLKGSLTRVLGGKAATEVVFHRCDLWANSDLSKAFRIARDFVDAYCLDSFDAWFFNDKETSEKTKAIKDEKSSQLVKEHYDKAKEILNSNRDKLDKLAKALLKNKVLYEDEVNNILNGKAVFNYGNS